MDEKTLLQEISDSLLETGSSKQRNSLLWVKYGKEIMDCIEQGISIKNVWIYLKSKGRYNASYQYFVRQLRKYKEKVESHEHTTTTETKSEAEHIETVQQKGKILEMYNNVALNRPIKKKPFFDPLDDIE